MEIEIQENEQVTAVCALIRRFAHEILAREKQYQDDLLVSCLQLILSLPAECIADDFADYVPAIQVRFSPSADRSTESRLVSAGLESRSDFLALGRADGEQFGTLVSFTGLESGEVLRTDPSVAR